MLSKSLDPLGKEEEGMVSKNVQWDLEADIRRSGLTWSQLETPRTEMTGGLLSATYVPGRVLCLSKSL